MNAHYVRMRPGMPPTEDHAREVLKRIRAIDGFDRVRFIFLYGSVATGQARIDSDIDLCLWYDGDTTEAERFRCACIKELSDSGFDLQIFSHLPLYIRIEVIRGRLLYAQDMRFVYDVAYRTIREFDDFKHRFYDYIGKEAMV
ncbi:MAG: DNA polymerase beta subunit [Methanomicrobiales archaeon 53_19]|nr:MAG: DNA polymerase beta subunit [Methanocalculus sp. 52_23]KUK99907.1 MAG: DNA polymerase beta subunit [Methanomicrobiales archaeon 53_19]